MAVAAVNTPPASAVDDADVQGIVRFGYGRMTEAAYLLLRIRDAAAARTWLRDAPVASAATLPAPPPSALQIAFTAPGLRTLGVADGAIAQFSVEFVSGMSGDESRSRRLGDVGANAPSAWRWGSGAALPDVMVMLFAQPGGLAQLEQRVTSQAAWNAAFTLLRRLETADLGGVEPFGFTDGISQPKPDWERQRDPSGDQLDYVNVVALGEFLLGYPNEYGKYTDRPLVDDGPAAAALSPAADVPSKRDLGLNGTYLVMRELEQDVRGFWQFVDRRARELALDPDALGAAFVGRARNGDTPLPVSDAPIPGIGPDPQEVRLNRFTYDADPLGVRCPLGAHVRRTNPRNADYAGRPAGFFARLISMIGFGKRGLHDDVMSATRFHRILRRGREYGPGLSPRDALAPAPPGEPERGLHFACVGANIARQFEFLQNAWVMNTKFDGLTGESDPLLGNREPIPGCPVTDAFTIPREGALRTRISGLPQFVTVRGGAYFVLPSLRALRYFAEVSV